MTLQPADIAHLLIALFLLLWIAHGAGFLFRRWGQPQVIGEILGGTILGPSVLKAFLPDMYDFVFARNALTLSALGAIHQIGLLLLMFCSGLEVRPHFRSAERRTAIAITLSGTLIPFLFSVPLILFVDTSRYIGSSGNTLSFWIIFAIGIAVTSIPVISRILIDLKLSDTSFARVVLSAAVAEDILLYVLLSLALALGGKRSEEAIDLPSLLQLVPGSFADIAFHLVATVLALGVALKYGPAIFRKLEGMRYYFPRRSSPLASLLLTLLSVTSIGLFLGVSPMLGAFAAGTAAGRMHRQPTAETEQAKEAIRSFSFAFFVPVYFAIVGLRLDLARSFDPGFFLFFFLTASLVKIGGVYLGARAAGESNASSTNLAMAMNARGGPCIVLASLALDAGLIHERFYSTLVVLAVLTSYLAGTWLQRLKKKPT